MKILLQIARKVRITSPELPPMAVQYTGHVINWSNLKVLPFENDIKETVSVISSYLPSKEYNAWFTSVWCFFWSMNYKADINDFRKLIIFQLWFLCINWIAHFYCRKKYRNYQILSIFDLEKHNIFNIIYQKIVLKVSLTLQLRF